MQIIPSILEKDFSIAENKIKLIKDKFRWMQIDVIDGFFSEGRSFELELLNKIEVQIQNNLIEVHLMVKEPINWIEKCNFVGATRIIGQVEKMTDREKFVDEVKNIGIDVGLAMDIDTEVKNIPKETDLVLLMGRKSGFESRPIDNRVFEKIKQLVKIKKENNYKFLIAVDGGVNEDNIKRFAESGVDIVYCTGAIFNGMVEDNLEKLKYVSEN
jgi:ribulose-phosphate 3-epimerase